MRGVVISPGRVSHRRGRLLRVRVRVRGADRIVAFGHAFAPRFDCGVPARPSRSGVRATFAP
jgi:hypothetical protein